MNHHLEILCRKAQDIENAVHEMLEILKTNFPEEYQLSYQHWVPQILTALDDKQQWLNRGVYNFKNVKTSILDKDNTSKGNIRKYINS